MQISASQCWAQAREEAPACAQTQGLRPAQSRLPGSASRCSSPRPRPNPCLVSKEGRTQYFWLQRSCTAGNLCVFSPDKKSCVFVQETERNPGPENRNRSLRPPDVGHGKASGTPHRVAGSPPPEPPSATPELRNLPGGGPSRSLSQIRYQLRTLL